MRNTLQTTLLLSLCLSCFCIHMSLASEPSQDIRKKLFLIERSLSGFSSKMAREDTLKLSSAVIDPQALKQEIEKGFTSAATNQEIDKKSSNSAPKDFGSVSAGLEGGRLTSFNYSSTGLDLTEYTGGSLVLFLQSNEIDISDIKQDENISDKFKSSASDGFYGLDEYKDMQNLFPKQAPGKDYTMTGVGMTFDMGAMQLGVINYSKPPEKKKKIFFGNDSAGPYQIGATGIIPGSEEVRVDGSVLTTGSGYSINYSKGEITFISLVGMSSRIIIEYELAQSSGGTPGKFTGFRLGTPKEKEDSKESGQGSSQGAA